MRTPSVKLCQLGSHLDEHPPGADVRVPEQHRLLPLHRREEDRVSSAHKSCKFEGLHWGLSTQGTHSASLCLAPRAVLETTLLLSRSGRLAARAVAARHPTPISTPHGARGGGAGPHPSSGGDVLDVEAPDLAGRLLGHHGRRVTREVRCWATTTAPPLSAPHTTQSTTHTPLPCCCHCRHQDSQQQQPSCPTACAVAAPWEGVATSGPPQVDGNDTAEAMLPSLGRRKIQDDHMSSDGLQCRHRECLVIRWRRKVPTGEGPYGGNSLPPYNK